MVRSTSPLDDVSLGNDNPVKLAAEKLGCGQREHLQRLGAVVREGLVVRLVDIVPLPELKISSWLQWVNRCMCSCLVF